MGSMLGSILSATVLTILPEATRSFDSYRTVSYTQLDVYKRQVQYGLVEGQGAAVVAASHGQLLVHAFRADADAHAAQLIAALQRVCLLYTSRTWR